MTNYICDPQNNFVKGAQYTKQTLPSDISQSTATKECVRLAKGRDFFVQQRDDGHTFCGIFNKHTPQMGYCVPRARPGTYIQG